MNFLRVFSGGVQSGLLPDKIQREEVGLNPISPLGEIDEGAQHVVDSNGYRVNVGNFDENGLNVNNWNDDNRNDNLGVASSRQFILRQAPLMRRFAYRHFSATASTRQASYLLRLFVAA